ARALAETESVQRPIVVWAHDRELGHLGAEMLKRALGVDALTLSKYLKLREQTEKEATEQKGQKSDEPLPLLIALDGKWLPPLSDAHRSWHKVIYLGVDYGPQTREHLNLINAVVVNPEELSVTERGFEASSFGLLFKLCQATAGLRSAEFLADYVALDIETTDRDVDGNDIIEIAAIRVRDGIPGEHFHSLVKPGRPIAQDAERIHGITENEVVDAPNFVDIIDRFLEFIGEDMLVAHNGYNFDFPIINRKL